MKVPWNQWGLCYPTDSYTLNSGMLVCLSTKFTHQGSKVSGGAETVVVWCGAQKLGPSREFFRSLNVRTIDSSFRSPLYESDGVILENIMVRKIRHKLWISCRSQSIRDVGRQALNTWRLSIQSSQRMVGYHSGIATSTSEKSYRKQSAEIRVGRSNLDWGSPGLISW